MSGSNKTDYLTCQIIFGKSGISVHPFFFSI